MAGLLQTILDPAGVTSFLADNGGPVAPGQPDTTPSFWNGGDNSFLNRLRRTLEDANKQVKTKGFFRDMAPDGSFPLAGAFDPNAKVAPPTFQAQWSYAPGKGPQWVEPKRVSSDNSVPWAAQVNNGPAKGNRF